MLLWRCRAAHRRPRAGAGAGAGDATLYTVVSLAAVDSNRARRDRGRGSWCVYWGRRTSLVVTLVHKRVGPKINIASPCGRPVVAIAFGWPIRARLPWLLTSCHDGYRGTRQSWESSVFLKYPICGPSRRREWLIGSSGEPSHCRQDCYGSTPLQRVETMTNALVDGPVSSGINCEMCQGTAK